MIRFILESYIFKKLFLATIAWIIAVYAGSWLFDSIWKSLSILALTDLSDVYTPPLQYNNIKKVNLSFIPPDMVCIEGNSMLKIAGSRKDYGYFDTAKITLPTETSELRNKIFIQFKDSKFQDSIYLVISKSAEKDVYWRQIFLSSVLIRKLNETGADTSNFRLDKSKFVSDGLLEDNDTLINQALNYFNSHKDSLELGNCVVNSWLFIRICAQYSLPCRIVGLKGGDKDEAGYNDELGYPSHQICEVYSSKYQKWYVIDPTYGFRFKQADALGFMNAVEISDKYFFLREKEIEQDSILFTKRTLLGRDYFKYYENVFFQNNYQPNFLLKKIIHVFYAKFAYDGYMYANNTPTVKNGKNYFIFKSLFYLFLLIMHINFTIFIITKRLMQSKKPSNHNKL